MKGLSSMAGFHEKTSAKRKTIMSREFRQAVKARQDGNQGLHKPLTEVADSHATRALSFPGWWYSTIRKHLNRPIDLLTWKHRTTQFELFLTPSGQRMVNDPQLKVILIKDKGKFHR